MAYYSSDTTDYDWRLVGVPPPPTPAKTRERRRQVEPLREFSTGCATAWPRAFADWLRGTASLRPSSGRHRPILLKPSEPARPSANTATPPPEPEPTCEIDHQIANFHARKFEVNLTVDTSAYALGRSAPDRVEVSILQPAAGESPGEVIGITLLDKDDEVPPIDLIFR